MQSCTLRFSLEVTDLRFDFFFLFPRMTALSLSFSTHRHSLILYGTSHPITCDGRYHARVMAGGESQLCVVVADRLLNRFSGVVGRCYLLSLD